MALVGGLLRILSAATQIKIQLRSIRESYLDCNLARCPYQEPCEVSRLTFQLFEPAALKAMVVVGISEGRYLFAATGIDIVAPGFANVRWTTSERG